MRLKKNSIQKLKVKSGWSFPHFSLLAVTIVTIGVTLLFHNNAREIDRLRLENMAAKVSESLEDAITVRQIRLAADISPDARTVRHPEENAGPETDPADGILTLKKVPINQYKVPELVEVSVKTSPGLQNNIIITPSTIDKDVIRMAGKSDKLFVSTVELTTPGGKRENALMILGLPRDPQTNNENIVTELPFSIMRLDQVSKVIAKSLPGKELAVELRSKTGRTSTPANPNATGGFIYSGTGQTLKVDKHDSGLMIKYTPTKSFWKESNIYLTILIPIVGALLGMLLFALLRFDASFKERITIVAKELDVARSKNNALLESEKIARREADIANVAKDEFMATISHEIRTPLNAIGGWAKILEDDGIPATTKKEALNTINRNIKKQSHIINELLLYSSLSGEKTLKEFDLVEAPLLIGEVLEIVRPAAEKKQIEFLDKIELQGEKIYCDRNKVITALQNLFSNAIKFTPSGGEIRFSAEKHGEFVRLLIRDTGKGIERELLPHIFDKFRQSDSSTTRQFGGLGLGLAIAKRIIKLHGGFIRVRSAGKNAGSEFEIGLPVDG